MKRTVLLALTICICSMSVLAQRDRPPRFEDYPVKQKFHGTPARINFRSCSLARSYRTRLREAVAMGPNFAGRYGVNYWGCGTERQQIGIVDLKSGQVYLSPFAAQFDIETRVNSRLLIVNPAAKLKELFGDSQHPYYTEYYLWEKGRLELIYPTELIGKIQNNLKSCAPK